MCREAERKEATKRKGFSTSVQLRGSKMETDSSSDEIIPTADGAGICGAGCAVSVYEG